MIEIVGNELYQWDTGRVAQITGIEVEYVHFANMGDSHAVIMGAVDIHAKIPDFLLQSGKQLCVYAVKDGITVESKTFYVKKRERPENYVYEDDRRNYIYELVENAENALESMRWAYEDTTLATENANLAAENANRSADSANLAARNAYEASFKANHTAKNLMVIGSSKGDNIHLDDAVDQYLVGLRIFGKTTQDGTPTPNAPVDLVSVGNGGSITVNVSGDNDAQSMTVATPNGLRGIPVASGGNYTDANGQQWVCDELDFARGVYVQRIERFSFTVADMNSSEGYPGWKNSGFAKYYPNASNAIGRYGAVAMCNIDSNPSESVHINTTTTGDVMMIPNPNKMTQSEWKTNYPNLMFELIVSIPTPIETPLSAEELAAYAALHTYRGNTTVFNDASAHMEIEYAVDAKTYIGRLITGISSPSRVVNVSLPASKWAGSGNLYSQVVSIDGITENSQVNLTPSVEQLSIFYEKDVTFITENDGGTVTVYVIGQKPTNDYTIKASIVEVIA